ncbi:hypothetical protein [Chryseobacterium sp.]|uniref:hypothetical protein n=1 Tax=Chryseobacterium sp. TaxID=1871047 RepID=UPI000EE172EC|nr:hypothetical protein [Chryseobacterium sp.]HCM34123.1 hypothetical protein [Chryseobacterium sp.]
MKTQLILTPEVQAIVDAIKNTGKSWYETMLPDHAMFPQFTRKLVVTGFNTPDMEGDEDRIYVNVRQYLILKSDNKIYKRIQMPDWMIHEGNLEEILGKTGFLKGTLRIMDDEGNLIEEKEQVIKLPSVQYIRFLINTKSVHLADVIARFIPLYLQLHKTQIDSI